MQVKLVGVQYVNFTNNNGETINGTNIFCAFKDENVEGLRTEKFFLKDGINLPKWAAMSKSGSMPKRSVRTNETSILRTPLPI